MNKADLITWLAVLPADSPDLARVEAIRRGTDAERGSPLLSLAELTPAVGFKHYASLSRLGVKAVAEPFGGRPRYRLERVLTYLASPECERVRAKLRKDRKERDQARKVRAR
jgi:hypothetical protein